MALGIKDGGAILAEETGIHGKTCKTCRQKSKIYGFLSPLRYHDTLIENLIHSMKYNGIRSVSKTLADILADYFNKYSVSFPRDAVMIPIPLHKKRERIRGFNQAVLIGKHLSERIGIELRADILCKVKETRRQTGLSAEERKNNLSGVFALRDSAALKNKTVLLLDDVRTTGSTMEEATGVLKSAGARRVWAITAAH
jgi:competence protein ComFC